MTIPNRVAIAQELESTRVDFHQLMASIPPTAWRKRGPGSAWTVKEELWHIAWGARFMLDLIKNSRRGIGLPKPPMMVADWLNAYVVKVQPDNELLRQKWMTDGDPMASRAGWNLTSQRVIKNPEVLDIPALLDRIENEMSQAPEEARWTMNFSLAEIGIHHPEHRERAIQIGEKLGVYRDYPVSKGCTSPFAPIWINEMVKRQKSQAES